MTRLRPDKILELESDDYSRFGSNAYAKGFLQIYGRYLGVDVSSHVRALETSLRVNVEEYQYLNNVPEPSEVRTASRRELRPPSMVPAFVFLGIVALGAWGFWINVNAQRLDLSSSLDTAIVSAVNTAPTPTPEPVQRASTDMGIQGLEIAPAPEIVLPLPASNIIPAEILEAPAKAEKIEGQQEARADSPQEAASPAPAALAGAESSDPDPEQPEEAPAPAPSTKTPKKSKKQTESPRRYSKTTLTSSRNR